MKKNFRLFDVIRRPVITEKSMASLESGNQVLFIVANDATKPLIKEAIEFIYSVKVKAVNTLINKGKTKRFRGRIGKQKDVKKAIVTLAEGSKIDDLAGGV